MEQQAISSDLIRGHIDTIILHALIDGDKFAQQISDAIEEKSNGDYKMNQATLYSSLKRLENLKYVTSYWFDCGENNGRRKFFKITELGKQTVENNLSNWSFSRALIDRLVDCTPEPVYKTQYIEKIVEVKVPVSTSPAQIQDKNFENNANSQDATKNPADNSRNLSVFNENLSKSDSERSSQTQQEVNFRNILNGLIRTTQPKKQEKPTELEPVVKIPEETAGEKLKFNETITAVDYNAHKTQNNGKIDFGDLVLKAAKEGYKIRISSKDSSLSSGTLLINKLYLCSSLATYALFLIEFLLVALLGNTILGLSPLAIALIIITATIFPAISLAFYVKKPAKRTSKKIYSDIILTTAIIVFNLLLITFAGNLIFNVNFNNTFDLLVYFVLPTVVYIDVLIYFTVKYYFSKNKKFYCK